MTNLFNYSFDKSSKKGEIYTPIMDLSDLKDIDNLCFELKKRRLNIDVLILNAGLQYTGSKTPRRSVQGIELTFAVNHLGHQYLVQRILPLLLKYRHFQYLLKKKYCFINQDQSQECLNLFYF